MDKRARFEHLRDLADKHGGRAKTAVSIHRLTWATVIVAVLIVTRVPQIAALVPLPPRSGAELLLAMFGAFFTALNFVLWLCIFPMHALPERLRPAHDHWLGQKTVWLDAHFGVKIDHALERLRQHRHWLLLFVPVFMIPLTLSWTTPLAVHIAMLALWLALRTRLEAIGWRLMHGPEDMREAARKLFERAMTLILVTNAIGELLWNAQEIVSGDLKYRLYSTWAMLQTVLALVLLVSVIDALSVLGVPWIRSKALLVLAASLIVYSGGERVGSTNVQGVTVTRSHARAQGEAQPWIDALLARIDEIPATHPVVLVAASGGGSRAALLASLVYEKLRLIPTAHEGDPPRTLADDVLLISSVSGGSLATAYFLTLDREQQKQGKLSAHVEIAQNEFVQSMATDFMAPLLRGVLNLKQERGASVSSFWNERFSWSAMNDGNMRLHFRPLVVFSATAVQSGTRMGIGFPALPAEVFRPMLVPADIHPTPRIALAEAVRLSANFPYGFEYAVLSESDSVDAKGRPIDNQIIDGGIVDNTGLDTLAMVMDAIGKQAAAAPVEGDGTGLSPYQRALDELRRRGALLIEIDAGARPSPPTWPATSFTSLSKPVEALGQAGHRSASILREHNIAQIRASLDADEPVPAVVGVVRAGFDCDKEGDVITAWALDHGKREQIYADFRGVEDLFARSVELQLQAVTRLQDARWANAEKIALSSDPVVTAKGLRAAYETYLTQAMALDGIEHSNAIDCAERKAERLTDLVERSLRDALRGASYLEVAARNTRAPVNAPEEITGPVAPAEPAAAADGDDEIAATEPAQKPEPPVVAPPIEQAPAVVPKSGLGWVYLGNRSESRWQTKYTSFKGKDLPEKGEVVSVVGASYVRTAPPDDKGRLAPVRIALKPETPVEIVETRDWGGTGFIWARVSTPRVEQVQKTPDAPASAE